MKPLKWALIWQWQMQDVVNSLIVTTATTITSDIYITLVSTKIRAKINWRWGGT